MVPNWCVVCHSSSTLCWYISRSGPFGGWLSASSIQFNSGFPPMKEVPGMSSLPACLMVTLATRIWACQFCSTMGATISGLANFPPIEAQGCTPRALHDQERSTLHDLQTTDQGRAAHHPPGAVSRDVLASPPSANGASSRAAASTDVARRHRDRRHGARRHR